MPYTAQLGLPYAPGSDTSYVAAVKAKNFVGPQGEAVYQFVVGRGTFGATMKEAERLMPIGRPSACARFNALEEQGRLVKTMEKRCGCAVYRAR